MIAWEVHALRYATNEGARRPDNFLGGDPHDAPMPLDYYIWLLRSPGRFIVVDTGFDAEMARKRGRILFDTPDVLLAGMGVAAGEVQDVVITHLHYDHAGNLHLFPKARFHLQEREMAYATGRYMTHAPLRSAFEAEHVAAMVFRVYEGRVQYHDGTAAIAPGVELHRVGGHTDGLQIVRVWTTRGWLVLASDASHFMENAESSRVFPIVFHHGEMLDGHRRCYELADHADAVIPGHDPLVMDHYPASSLEMTGKAVRLDLGRSPA